MRHAKSIVDPTTPAAQWSLAPDAAAAAASLGTALPRVTTLLSSDEPKAVGTAAALGVGPSTALAAFREVERPFYDDTAGLTTAVANWFDGQTIAGWEPFDTAVERFATGLAAYDRDGLVVVTHGTVMTAWLQSENLLDDPFAFWSDLRMPDAWSLSPTLIRCPAP